MPKVGDTSDLPEYIPRLSCDIKLWTAFILGEIDYAYIAILSSNDP